MRKLVFISTLILVSTILLRYTMISACPNNQIVQDYFNKNQNYKNTWNPYGNKKEDSSKIKNENSSANFNNEPVFDYPLDKSFPNPPKNNYNFGQPSLYDMKQNNKNVFFDNSTFTSKASDVKDELEKTKKMLNDVKNKAKAEINNEIKRSKLSIDDIIKDKNMDLETKKEKIYEIKKNLKKKIRKTEDDVVKQVKEIIEQQYEKTDLLLNSVNP